MDTFYNMLSDIADFISSIVNTIEQLVQFGAKCINELAQLLNVIPATVSTLIICMVTFSIVIACKRAILD